MRQAVSSLRSAKHPLRRVESGKPMEGLKLLAAVCISPAGAAALRWAQPTGPTMIAQTGGERLTPTQVVLAVMALGLALRAVLAAIAGLSVDEAYIVVMAREPGLGYFDHPPLTMWVVHAVVWLFGSEAPLVSRIPGLLSFAGTTWFLFRTTARLFSPWAGAYAAIALNLTPIFTFYFATMLVTDGVALFAVSLAAWLLSHALMPSGDGRANAAWIGAGAAFGAALLAKFSVVLLAPGVVVFLLTVPQQRRWLRRPAPYIGALAALVVLSPNLYWNATNDWLMFSFQGGRAAIDGSIHLVRTLSKLGVMALIYFPFVWIALIIALRRGPADQSSWLFACMAAVPIFFYPLVWLFGAQTDHGFQWPAPGYLMAFPLLGAEIEAASKYRSRQIRTIGTTAAAVFVLGYAIYLADYFIGWVPALAGPFPDGDPVIVDQIDWWALRRVIDEKGLLDPEKAFVIAGNWNDCAKAARVVGDTLEVVCLTDNPIQRVFPPTDSLIGRDAIIVTNYWSRRDARAALEAKFASLEEMKPVPIASFGWLVTSFDLLYGRDLQAPLSRND